MNAFFLSVGVGIALVAVSESTNGQSPIPLNKPPLYPAWWFQRNVILRTNPNNLNPDFNKPGDYPVANDFAALTQGQLKNIALAAYDEFVADVGASEDLDALIGKWIQINPQTHKREEKVTEKTNDYAVVNLGQLKAVAKPFYDALITLNAIPGYPWDTAPNSPSDYSIANVGQAKQLFFFDLTQFGYGSGTPTDPITHNPGWVDATNNGWPNTWLGYYHVDFGSLGGVDGDIDADGLTTLQEYRLGTSLTKKDNPAVKLTASGMCVQ